MTAMELTWYEGGTGGKGGNTPSDAPGGGPAGNGGKGGKAYINPEDARVKVGKLIGEELPLIGYHY